MTEHHRLTGRFAIHQAAFFQDTDPAIDSDNFVGPGKWWVDSGNGNALKMRNDANDGWITIFSGASQVGSVFVRITYVYTLIEPPGVDLDDLEWTTITHI